jgi:ATP-binding cassette subfamily B protein
MEDTNLPQPSGPGPAGSGPDDSGAGAPPGESAQKELPLRILAVQSAARYYGTELDAGELRRIAAGAIPTVTELSKWVQESGMWARATRLQWRHLMKLQDTGPVVLMFNDGTAGVLTAVNPSKNVVFLRDPRTRADEAGVAVDELRLRQVWSGEVLLLRAERGIPEGEAPFSIMWLAGLVYKEKKSLRDIAIATIVISIVTIVPPLMVMSVIDRALTHHSINTVEFLAIIFSVFILFETVISHARRLITVIVSMRVDTRLNLHMFNRVLKLPLDYFERNPGGETLHKIQKVYAVREFLTGKLLTTFLDLVSLVILLPVLFYLNSTLSWIVMACAGMISLIILAFLRPMRILFGKVIMAENEKAAVITETVYGIRTVKTLALEPVREALWDGKVADSGKWRLAYAKLSSWPQTLVVPFERFMFSGIILIAAAIALTDSTGTFQVGALFAFTMLSGRVAAPLVGLARLTQEYEEVHASVGEVGSVLNRPIESNPASGGLRPKIDGAISFEDVTFTYSGTKTPALDRLSFSIPAGTMLGLVGRSGSGKSTVTRLLQAVNREYSGYVKLDGSDLREINLRYLRQSLGVVLQDNFLFRGSIRDNIISGRVGLSQDDVVRAARLAGAEEFIERMPQGYETFIQEGSPNLSGGQKQRLAIARALIIDPRILILDEATSALDPESEALVNANLQRIARGRTMVIVSHRLSSLTDCDQILVLDKGKIIDIGPHRVLLERCAVYRQLWQQQNRHMETGGTRPIAIAPAIGQAD